MALDNFKKTSMRIDKANQRFLDYQNAKVGDVNGRELLVQITNNGVVEDQTGTTLKLNWQHENGNQDSTNFKVVDIKTGKYSLYYPSKMLYKGTVEASVEINSNGQITHSMNFKIIVHADVFNGEAGTVNGVFISLADVNKKLDDREKEYVELKERQTTVENQFNAIQQDLTDKDVISSPEIIVARGGEETLGARLQKNDDRLSESTYFVGKYQEYKTLNEAFNQWKTDGMPVATIQVKETLIEEYLNIGGLKNANRLTIAGEDKHTTVWKYVDGRYEYATFTGGGNITIKNFTVIADHDETWVETANGAYALHVDHPGAVGEVIIKDCILVSYQDAALGSGTRKNQIITLNDVELYHYANTNSAGATGRNHGALFYHTSNTAGDTGQRLNLYNVYAYSKYGPALALQSSGGGDQEVLVEAIGVTGRSDFYEQYTGSIYDDRVSIFNPDGKIVMSENNRNNNSDKLNYSKLQKLELTDATGRAIQVTDFNNATSGYFRGENATNAPNNRAFVGFAVKYSSVLIVQYAYDVLIVGVTYKRQYVGSYWSDWTPVNDVGQATTTSNRPTGLRPGYMTFDITLQKPIWWNGTTWKDATGQTV